MVVQFASGRLTPAAAKQRMVETTAEQLAALTNDPAFHEWQAQKARRENTARTVTNLLAVAACVLLAVTMALLKPAANSAPLLPSDAVTVPPAYAFEAAVSAAHAAAAEGSTAAPTSPTTSDAAQCPTELPPGVLAADEAQRLLEMAQYRVDSAHAEAEAAQDAAAELALQLRLAQEQRDETAARLAAAQAAAVDKEAEVEASEAEAKAVVEHLMARLADMQKQVAAFQAAADQAANLAEATTAAAAALMDGQGLEAGPLLPPQMPAALGGALPGSFNASLLRGPSANRAPAATPLASLPAPALHIAAGALLLVLLALLATHLRSRRRLAAEAARAASLSARLKEAAFAKDTAEQSLGLLERELQRRMKQLEEAQQAASEAASPRIGTMPSPPPPGALLTPGRGELPPPPASLVEKFLRDHNFLAVQQEQMTEWLEMEQQFGEMQAALGELQAALADKDSQIAAYQQDLSSANEHTSLELRSREDQLAQVRAWLDEAQEQLLETQGALQEREAECRRVSTQLEAVQALAAGAQESAASLEGRDSALMAQNLELVGQLQSVTAAYEALREQLASLQAAGAQRPASAASTVPGTPVDLSRDVQNCLEMMRATRAQLADRLAHSQNVCEAMIADCQMAHGGQQVLADGVAEGEGASSPDGTPAAAPAPFGSPAALTPLTNPLFESGPEGWEGSDDLLAAAQQEESASAEPAVLGPSSRHNAASRQTTPSTAAASNCQSGASCAGDCSPSGPHSMRAAWQSAQTRVAEARAQCSAWDLAGFVRGLGFQIEADSDGAAPMDREQFEALRGRAEEALAAAAGLAATSPERALAGQAMQVIHDWQFPALRINTPPPSPFWRLLSGLS